ncbi:actin-binding protein wsp1-like [Magnolia sinica]|uniref:actin-binding protein wsp1-like n=1 Tax=Magnolia sinica TaxID=86752 RepID=UPI0026587CB1|nr:actin-binding protein wsp1-like [Magnolia sinica]
MRAEVPIQPIPPVTPGPPPIPLPQPAVPVTKAPVAPVPPPIPPPRPVVPVTEASVTPAFSTVPIGAEHFQQLMSGIRGVSALSSFSGRGHCSCPLLVLLNSSRERNFHPPLLGIFLSSRGSQADLLSRDNNSRDSTSRDNNSHSTSRGDIQYGVILDCVARTVTFHIPGLSYSSSLPSSE